MTKKPVMLCILDGWAMNPAKENNAVALANTPNFDRLWNENPHTTLRADGLFVGLPEGQFGNSEVGHTNIGAGRVVMQELPRITQAVKDGSLAKNETLNAFAERLQKSGGRAHVMGLVSDGGVHAHMEHIAAVVKILSAKGVHVVVHIFTDGRDTPPASGHDYVTKFLRDIAGLENTEIATVSGRYYAMDRDNRWDRVSLAFNAIAKGEGIKMHDALEAIQTSYDNNEQDEFIKPVVLGDYAGMLPNDGVLMANFRSDRAREILKALVQRDFDGFDRGTYHVPTDNIGMVDYSEELNKDLKTLFPPISMADLTGDLVARAGKTQLRAAETEKYPHVTFFFNGGREDPYTGEQRILVPSPKVATYDLQPEMSAVELTDKMVNAIYSGDFDFIVLNYANPDMVGHSGDLKATIKAVETVDTCLGKIEAAVKAQNGILAVTADHGNADQMVDPVTGQPYTAHTTFPVPFILTGSDAKELRSDGKLGDIAPTLLQLLGIEKPPAMTGETLIIG